MTRHVRLVPLQDGTYTFEIEGNQYLTNDEVREIITSPELLEASETKAVLSRLVPASVWLRERCRRFRAEFPWIDTLLEFGADCQPVKHDGFLERYAGHCFLVAFVSTLDMRERGLTIDYVEGIGIFSERVLHHAWTLYQDRVFDFSWPSPLLARYFGVCFEPQWIDETFGLTTRKGKVSVFRHWKTHHREIRRYLEERSRG